ncbi:MAG: exodeoxyribonuclease V subunit gamma [Candidatus Makana argininalis]
MFIIYHSNDTDMLKIIMSLLISFKKKDIDPLKPEIIVVKNKNISKWIKIKLSEELGIYANIKFITISKFIWTMISNIFPKVKYKYIYNKYIMTWKIMSLIPNLVDDKHFNKVKFFLNKNDILKKFKFSSSLSYIFNQYLIYRPDWLKSWMKGKLIYGLSEEQIWQSCLWRKLIKKKTNFNELILQNYDNFDFIKKIIDKKNKKKIKLPHRAFIFGISSMPPIYIKLLELLGNYMDVHNMIINPCKDYWGDIENLNFFEKKINKYIKESNKIVYLKDKKENIFLQNINKYNLENYFLSSLGKKCKEYIYLISNLNRTIEINAFIKPNKNNILSLIKKDIFFFPNYSLQNEKNSHFSKISKRIIKITDFSISINACNSFYKEIKILYDKLLILMSKDSTLKPQDIIVMAPNINNYLPSIESIFKKYNLKNHLPFYISDVKSKKINSISQAFIKLLDLPFIKLSTKDILRLLEVKSISYKFNIQNKEIDILKKWILESGIKIELDEEKNNNKLINNFNSLNSCDFEINRMFLGYAMKSNYGYWNKILPYNKTYGVSYVLLGNFYDLINKIKYLKKKLLKPKKIKSWFPIYNVIISSFFCATSYEEKNIFILIKSTWKKILNNCLKSKFKEKISIKLIKEELFNLINKKKIIKNFLFGKINFCNLKSMCSVNFRVVCILGINDNILIKNNYKNNFNLIYKHPRIGDKNILEDYKYIFLESILSSSDIFYVSFIGNDIKNNNINTNSRFVNELMDYISKNFYIEGDQYLEEKKIINNVIKHIFKFHDKKNYLKQNIFNYKKKFFNFKKNFINFKNDLSLNSKLLLNCKNKILQLKDIILFYKNPIKTWFIKNLGIYFNESSIENLYQKKYINNIYKTFIIKEKILNLMIKKKNIIKIFNEIKYSGLLPYGIFGEIFFLEQYNKLINLYKKIQMFNISKRKILEIYLNFKNIKIIGWIYYFSNNGIVKWSTKKMTIKDGFILWIEHLIYCSSGGTNNSIMFFINGEWNFEPVKKIKAKNLLIYYILGYLKGILEPLLLFYNASNIWKKYCYNHKNKTLNKNINIKKKVKEKIIKYYNQKKEFYSEYNNIYIKKIIKNLNKKNINEMIFLFEKYLLPMLKFNKI